MPSLKEESKVNWCTPAAARATNEQIQLGCLMRIADATELMAKNYVELQKKAKREEERADRAHRDISHLYRRIYALKGQITKLKKQKEKKK